MKKWGKRLLGLMLAAALLCGTLPVGALAAEEEAVSVLQSADENTVRSAFGRSEAKLFNASAPSEKGDFYSQLNTRQKACYTALKAIPFSQIQTAAQVKDNGRTYRQVTVAVDGINGLTMSGSIRDNVFYADAASKATEESIYTDLYAATLALRFDHPEILWLRNNLYGYKTASSNNSSVKVTGVIFAFELEFGGEEGAMQERMMANAQAIADEAAQAPDTWSRVKLIHDRLAEGSAYGDPNQVMSHTAYSALVTDDEYEPVCDGYAMAFKVVCDLVSIPCVMPISAEHRWNNVKMDDGEWYNLDLTWDDAGETVIYDYFLVGSQTEINGEQFAQQDYHVEIDPYENASSSTVGRVDLRYPVKSKTAYEYIGEDYPPLAFSDVKRSAFYYEPVQWAVETGVTAGIGDGLFGPNNSCTRAEAVTFLWRAKGSPAPQSQANPFRDVPQGKYYTDAVLWAVENNIVYGVSPDRFNPQGVCNRGEIVTFLWRAEGSPAAAGTAGFTDVAAGRFYSQSVAWAVENRITAGIGDGKFGPGNNCVRGQIVTFLYNSEQKSTPLEGGM